MDKEEVCAMPFRDAVTSKELPAQERCTPYSSSQSVKRRPLLPIIASLWGRWAVTSGWEGGTEVCRGIGTGSEAEHTFTLVAGLSRMGGGSLRVLWYSVDGARCRVVWMQCLSRTRRSQVADHVNDEFAMRVVVDSSAAQPLLFDRRVL
jgi:hypothetical protein